MYLANATTGNRPAEPWWLVTFVSLIAGPGLAVGAIKPSYITLALTLLPWPVAVVATGFVLGDQVDRLGEWWREIRFWMAAVVYGWLIPIAFGAGLLARLGFRKLQTRR